MNKIIGVMVSVWFLCFSASEGLGQNSSGKLRDLIPSLYGGDGIFLATAGGHAPHFTLDSGASILSLNQNISSEIAQFPFSASGGGFTFSFDPESATFVRSTESLGPLFAERAQTLGRGKFNVGFSFSFFHYDTFEGQDLDNLRVVTRHQPDVLGSPTEREDFELDTILLTFNIDIRVQLYSFSVNYGITDRLDIGLLVPLVRVAMDVDANAEIVPSPSNTQPGIHQFGEESPRDSASDSAFGIGDIVFRAKYHLLASPVVDVATALLVKFATGDDANFLGTGDTTVRPFLVLSRTFFDVLTPHINIGYEFNLNKSDRNSFEYAVGSELRIFPRFTVIGGFIGSHELAGDGIGDNIVNASIGVKWNPVAQLIVAGNVQLPINDEGLRTRVLPTFVVEYSF